MKHIFKSILMLLLVLSSSQLMAQGGSLDFTIESDFFTMSDENYATHSIVVKTGDVFTWTQSKNGYSETTNFTITDFLGNWNQNTSQGSITYNLIYENFHCDFILSDQYSEVSAVIILKDGESEVYRYILNVNTISYQ